jgi:hypothetical protein
MDGVEQSKQSNLFAHSNQLLRHFEGDNTAVGVARQKVWPRRLHFSNVHEVEISHILDAGEWRALTIGALCLERIDGSIGPEMSREIIVVQYTPSRAVNAEQRPLAYAPSDLHQGRPGMRRRLDRHGAQIARANDATIVAEQSCQTFNGRELEQRGERQIMSGELTDLAEKTHCQQRMSAQFEEAVPPANRLDPQQLLPDMREQFLK